MQGVNDVIDHLAAKLSVPAAHLWAVLIRQAQAEALSDAILTALSVAFIVVALMNVRRLIAICAERDAEEVHVAVAITTLVIGGILFAVAIVGALVMTNELIQLAYNPEYYAVSKILSALTGK